MPHTTARVHVPLRRTCGTSAGRTPRSCLERCPTRTSPGCCRSLRPPQAPSYAPPPRPRAPRRQPLSRRLPRRSPAIRRLSPWRTQPLRSTPPAACRLAWSSPDPSSWWDLCVVFFADPRHLPAGSFSVVNLSTLRALLMLALCAMCGVVATPSESRAQSIAGCTLERAEQPVLHLIDLNHQRLTGTVNNPVQIECDDMQLFADSVELYRKEGRFTAEGHITFVSGANRIAAERMEFDTKTKMGTFYNASGTSVIRPGTPGEVPGGQEPYAYFWGDELHKIGPKKYKIVRGGFTACVQPTPRWEVSSGTLTLDVDDHVLLKNAVFRVKGVPILYMPIFYYPMQEDDRSTGFVMPQYGTGTIAGQKISNAFFWAIGRSHDATFVHDWFTKTGHGLGAEYRYQLGGGSAGSARFYRLNEKPITTTVNGVPTTGQGEQSYKLNGGLTQMLPGRLHLRA